MKTVGCIIARTASTRLPKKVLKTIKGKLMIEYIIEKMKCVNSLDSIYLCTSVDAEDSILLDIAINNGIRGYAGSRESVIDRMLDVGQKENADYVARVTGDNVFIDEIFLEKMISEVQKDPRIDYIRTEMVSMGVTAEVIKLKALRKCYSLIDPTKSEYLTLYMFNPDMFDCCVVIPEERLRAEYTSLTVDTPNDFERTRFIIEKLYKNGRVYYDDIIDLNKHCEIPNFNIDDGLKMKMPDNKMTTYGEFRKNIMTERIIKSKKIKLEDGFYENHRFV